MVSDRIQKILSHKSRLHQQELRRLGQVAQETPLSANALVLEQTKQVRGIHTLLLDADTPREDYIFYFDRMVALLVEKAVDLVPWEPHRVTTPSGQYSGLRNAAEASAVVILRGGSSFETGLRRTIPDCRAGRMLIQTSYRTGEPELHYHALPSSECVPAFELPRLTTRHCRTRPGAGAGAANVVWRRSADGCASAGRPRRVGRAHRVCDVPSWPGWRQPRSERIPRHPHHHCAHGRRSRGTVGRNEVSRLLSGPYASLQACIVQYKSCAVQHVLHV